MAPRLREAVLAAAGLLLFAQAQPWDGIRWGDGLEFAAVSAHLGIAHPPGYPLFTLLGWMMQGLPFSEPYDALRLLCRVAAAGAAFAVFVLLRRVFATEFPGPPEAPAWRPAQLAFAFALLFLTSHGMKESLFFVEVYGLNAALMLAAVALLLRGAFGARLPSTPEWLGAGACWGLAVANHLSSLSLLPLFLWGAARALKDRAWQAPLAAFAVAALIPAGLYGTLPLREPGLNGYGIAWGAPLTPERLLAHLRGGEYGQFQFLQAAPGVPFTLPLWMAFAAGRLGLVVEQFGSVVVGRGPTSFVGGLLVLGLVGAGMMAGFAQARWRGPVVALAAAAGLQVAFILTYNIPDIADYVLGVQALLFPFLAVGLGALLQLGFAKAPEKAETVLRGGAGLLLVMALATNFNAGRGAAAPLPSLWRERLLTTLPKGATILTQGDADIYTLWYEQFARGERRDLFVLGTNFLRFPWARFAMAPEDQRRVLVEFRPGPPGTLQQHVEHVNLMIYYLSTRGPIYATLSDPALLDALSRSNEIVPVAELLTEEEVEVLLRAGSVNVPPPVLFEIRRKP